MKILLAFKSKGLGGTSRSAVRFAYLWSQAGAEVYVYSPIRPHPSRVRELHNAGARLLCPADLNSAPNVDLVHLHHSAPSPDTLTWVSKIYEHVISDSTAVLTHNIFGQPLGVGKNHKLTVVGLLGDWLAYQYKFQLARSTRAPRRIVPNPQDFDYFRVPSQAERFDARRERGIPPGTHVLLRVGSPIEEKWDTRAYTELARKVISTPDMQLRLLGCPDRLREALPDHHRIVLLQSVSDDQELRNEYWAADAFAHWAHRGESFGNVLLEATGTGLPVVYKGREMRDNTPWEFQKFNNFHYVQSHNKWLDLCTSTRRRTDSTGASETFEYSDKFVRTALQICVDEVDVADDIDRGMVAYDALCRELRRPKVLSFSKKLKILVRHNPVSGYIKAVRLSIRNNRGRFRNR